MLKPRRNRRARTRYALAAAVCAGLLLSACDSAPAPDSGTDAAKGGGPSVVAPGRPGEPARTLSAEEAAKELPDDKPNSADRGYVEMMIVHHQQALEMTSLAGDRAGSDRVRKLADRIAAAQKPEVDAMKGWQQTEGVRNGSGGHGHDHGSMPGMATAAQLTQLRNAKGAAFDELFLKLMITHHQGAVTMATEVLTEGNNVRVEEMANDVISQQTSEIGRMRDM
ncbi:DUF305 domain-containing protein [Streptomyces genisteinicus]|uniref:DUF305 domain-containing protein n=1 Tax=Streptomyces genisteinicus TaxID=2768068 RepID=UPI001FE401D6|nr:DUF305 domain-containing protein [Streptomyces genisteinicus]